MSQAGELLGRDLRGGLIWVVGHARVDEEEIEPAGAEPVVEGLDLLGRVDVDGLDLQPPADGFLEVVQRSALRAANGPHDLGPPLEVLSGDRVAQAARRTDQENSRVL